MNLNILRVCPLPGNMLSFSFKLLGEVLTPIKDSELKKSEDWGTCNI